MILTSLMILRMNDDNFIIFCISLLKLMGGLISLFRGGENHIHRLSEERVHIDVIDSLATTLAAGSVHPMSNWLGDGRIISIPTDVIKELSLLRQGSTEFAGSLILSGNNATKVELWNNTQNTWKASMSFDSPINFHTHDNGGYSRTDINMPSPKDFSVVLNWSMPHHFNQAHIVVGKEGFYLVQVSGKLRAAALVEFKKGKSVFDAYLKSIEAKIQPLVDDNIFHGQDGLDKFLVAVNDMGFNMHVEPSTSDGFTVEIGSLDRVGELPQQRWGKTKWAMDHYILSADEVAVIEKSIKH